MNIIKIKTATIDRAADEAGMPPEKFVSKIRSISLGREVCAHFRGIEGEMSVFVCA